MQQRRAGDAHMNLPGAERMQKLGAVCKLRTSDNAVVAEENPLSLENGTVRDKLHLGDKVAGFLIDRHEGARPGRSVLRETVLVRDIVALGIAYCHSDTAVRDAAGAVDLGLVLPAHDPAGLVAHLLDILSFVDACRETVVNPEERADLHLGIRLADDLVAVCLDPDDLSRSDELVDFVAQIGECSGLAGNGVGTVFPTDGKRGAAPGVTGCDDSVL